MNHVSLRAYLAAHAPAEPQFWYQTPVMPEMPPERWVVYGSTPGSIAHEFSNIREASCWERATGNEVCDYNSTDRARWKTEWEKHSLKNINSGSSKP